METYEYRLESNKVKVFFKDTEIILDIKYSEVETLNNLRYKLYENFPTLNTYSIGGCVENFLSINMYDKKEKTLYINRFLVTLDDVPITDCILNQYSEDNRLFLKYKPMLKELETDVYESLGVETMLLGVGNGESEFLNDKIKKNKLIKSAYHLIRREIYAPFSFNEFKHSLFSNLTEGKLLGNDPFKNEYVKNNKVFFEICKNKKLKMVKLKKQHYVILNNFLPLEFHINEFNGIPKGMDVVETFYHAMFTTKKFLGLF